MKIFLPLLVVFGAIFGPTWAEETTCENAQLSPQARALDIATGNWRAQALRSFISTGLAEAMDGLCNDGNKYVSSSKIASKAGTHDGATYRLLRFLATMEVVVEGEDQTFTLGPIGQAVVPSNPGSVGGAVLLEASFPHLKHWNYLDDFLKSNEKTVQRALGVDDYWDYEQTDPEHFKIFQEAMSGYSKGDAEFLTTPELSPTLDLDKFETVCDLGCAEGRLALELSQRFKKPSKWILSDLPEAIGRLEGRTFPPNFITKAGSFLTSVPVADAYVLKNILHDWDDAKSITILKNIKKANPNAVVFVIGIGPIPGPNVPHLGKGIDLHMGLLFNGAERTPEQFETIFTNSGFERSATHLLADGNYHMYVEEIKAIE